MRTTRTTPVETKWTPIASARGLTILALLAVWAMLASSTASHAQQAPVGLGTAESFAVLAGETITNTGPTTITGDVGLHPGTEVTGFDSVTLHGELHIDDAVAEQAKADLVTAYNDAAGRSPTATVGTELGGQTLTGGVYDSESGTFEITGTLILDAQGNPDTVWVFQTESTLVTASASNVNLVNGADACNVFWQVGSSATLGTDSSFTGTIMALTSITLNTGATVEGRTLARNGAVTMDTNTITRPACAAADGEDDGAPDGEDEAAPDGEDEAAPDGEDDGAPDGEDEAAPDGEDDGAAEDDDATPPAVQPPTRIDTGAGGTAPPASRTGVLLLLTVAVAGTAVVLLRRVTNSG